MSNTAAPTKPARSFLEVILSVLVPPIGAYAAVGLSKHFWINIALTLLGYIPGVIHALWLAAQD